MTDSENISILTFNAGLLQFRLAGITIFSNPPYVNERYPFILNALKETNVEIICLQEVYDDFQAFELVEELKDKFPYNAREESGGLLTLHNGLLVLSKWPIIRKNLQLYNSVSTLEYYFATKSSLFVTIDVPVIGKISLANVHTTAGGTASPDAPNTDICREAELRQVIERCEEIAKDHFDEKIIIVGIFKPAIFLLCTHSLILFVYYQVILIVVLSHRKRTLLLY